MAESAEASRKTTARVVWATADKYLRNIVDEEDYGDYILPFTVLRRLECMLADSKDDVIKYVDAFAGMPQHLIDIAVKDKFGLGFYNISPLDLATIASVDDNVDKSLKSYIDGFSNNIADIWVSFDFNRRAKVLADANRLHAVVKHFSTLDLSPASLSNTGMGDVFEDVMYRAFNKKGKAAGNFYTPRDAIKLMVDVLIANDDDTLAGESTARSIYDPTAGSGGMLVIAQEALRRMNETIDVTLYGQELMPSAFALGKADLLIQGGRPDAIKQGNTLVEDLYEGQTFDYVLSNPPFGIDWEVEEKSVREQAKTPGSRFSHGLPSISDGQTLFLAHCASKLSPAGKNGQGGRAAVVSNAGPLFNGDKGPTAIREWLLDEDLIDAIIALPPSMFYGTGIPTYVWILDTNKDPERKKKVQLIDGSKQWTLLRRPMGEKRKEMRPTDRNPVLEAYKAFDRAHPEISHVMTPDDFRFRDIPVYKQARLTARFSDGVVKALRERKDFTDEHVAVLESLDGTSWNELPKALPQAAKVAGLKAPLSLVDAVMDAMAVTDEAAPPAVDRSGNAVTLRGWKITERVSLSEDLAVHMAREVVPFSPDAQWDEGKAKHGNEIPFARIFYTPRAPRPLDEIDSEVQELMGDLGKLDELTEAMRARAIDMAAIFGLSKETPSQDENTQSPLAGIPEHWGRTKFGYDFTESTERNGDNPPGPLLSISEYRGVELNTRTDGQQASLDVAKYRVVRPGQLAANMMWLNHGGLGVSSLTGYISPDYKAFWISPRFHPRYVHHLLRSPRYVDYFGAIGTGVRPNAQRVTKTALDMMPLPLPPMNEQERIADHLDEVTGRIDGMLTKIVSLRELLVERSSAFLLNVGTGR